MAEIKCVGILTSGGDAPGMNAAIRAVTRTAIYNGFEVKGIMRGYRGLITNEILPFRTQNVSNIIQQGGTILKTARCMEFKTPEGRKLAYENMQAHGIDALVVIGGDGSLTGARVFASEYNFPIVGLPGTIDNDLFGTDTTIGYDTALNTIMEAVDKIRDTATSHERLFFIEVMGREAGFLALNGAIASGAEAAIIPEIATEVDQLSELIGNGFRKSKNSSIVLVAESELTGGATGLAERVKNEFPQYDVRVTILGHIRVVVRLRQVTVSWPAEWVKPQSTHCSRGNVTSWSASKMTNWFTFHSAKRLRIRSRSIAICSIRLRFFRSNFPQTILMIIERPFSGRFFCR